MLVYVPKEVSEKESRAALTPDTVGKLTGLGATVEFEPGIGSRADYPDAAYLAAGARAKGREEGLAGADIVFRVTPPAPAEIARMKRGAMVVGFLAPFHVHLGDGAAPAETEEKARLDALVAAGVTGISLELMPRSTLAQKMDAISSQANLAGYVGVMLAANRLTKILPMMMTPSGTISPAKVFVVGIGVAGLQAIATARRLGARVTAFDTRPEALEQAESLGAKALRIDLGQTGSTDQGYAKELTAEQIEKQRQEQAKICVQSDIVITTAKLFGRRAPVLIQRDVVERMAHGSILVDLAAETGGNVEGIRLDEETVTPGGVRLIGYGKLETFVPRDASAMFANNLANFVEHFWDSAAKSVRLDGLQDPILKSSVLTHDGQFVNPHPAFRA